MKQPNLYEKIFLRILREEESLMRTDKRGRKIKVPLGDTFQQGKNGRGIAVSPGSRAEADDTGQLVELAPGSSLKIGDDGRGVEVAPGETVTKNPNGSLKVRRPLPDLGEPHSQLEILRQLKAMNRRARS